MSRTSINGDRRTGTLLMAFVALQVVYLVIDIGVLSPPAPEAPIGEWRTVITEDRDLLRWHGLLAFGSFFGLWLPGVFGLRRVLTRRTAGVTEADMIVPAAITMLISTSLTLMTTGILGLVPEAELSDAVLRTMVMVNEWSAFVLGGVVVALFSIVVSLTMRRCDQPPRLLSVAGMIIGCLSAVGTLWLISSDTDGLLIGLEMISRAAWVVWTAATGAWLIRTAPRRSTRQPARTVAHSATAATA